MEVDLYSIIDAVLDYHKEQVQALVEDGAAVSGVKAEAARELLDIIMGIVPADEDGSLPERIRQRVDNLYGKIYFRRNKYGAD